MSKVDMKYLTLSFKRHMRPKFTRNPFRHLLLTWDVFTLAITIQNTKNTLLMHVYRDKKNHIMVSRTL